MSQYYVFAAEHTTVHKVWPGACNLPHDTYIYYVNVYRFERQGWIRVVVASDGYHGIRYVPEDAVPSGIRTKALLLV